MLVKCARTNLSEDLGDELRVHPMQGECPVNVTEFLQENVEATTSDVGGLWGLGVLRDRGTAASHAPRLVAGEPGYGLVLKDGGLDQRLDARLELLHHALQSSCPCRA